MQPQSHEVHEGPRRNAKSGFCFVSLRVLRDFVVAFELGKRSKKVQLYEPEIMCIKLKSLNFTGSAEHKNG